MTKYRNRPVTVDGIRFDSAREAARWGELLLLERAGRIERLRRQVAYVLAPGLRIEGETRARPALRYVADFAYIDCATGRPVVEDVKGMPTPLYRAKKHLLAAVHGVHVREV